MESSPVGTTRVCIPLTGTPHGPITMQTHSIDYVTVRRALGHLFAVSFQLCFRRNIFWANTALGHSLEAPTRAEDTTFGGWAHASSVCHADRRYPKCPQFNYEQHRWHGL